jgi:hypothetical protein
VDDLITVEKIVRTQLHFDSHSDLRCPLPPPCHIKQKLLRVVIADIEVLMSQPELPKILRATVLL